MKILLKAGDSPYTTEIDPGVMGVEITEAFNGVLFRTADGEELAVSMRDTGFEVHYWGPFSSYLLGVDESTRFVEFKAGAVTTHDQHGETREA